MIYRLLSALRIRGMRAVWFRQNLRALPVVIVVIVAGAAKQCVEVLLW